MVKTTSNLPNTNSIAPEMRIYSPEGERLYLNSVERNRFLEAARQDDNPNASLFCSLLHYTGARPTELRELTVDRLDLDSSIVALRSLKKRKFTNKGEIKQPQYRSVPIPKRIMESLALACSLRARQKQKGAQTDYLWSSDTKPGQPVDAATAYRWVKRAMLKAGITGKKASAKGLRHALGVHLVSKGIPITLIRDILGHTDTKTTEVYLQIMGDEKANLILSTWEEE